MSELIDLRAGAVAAGADRIGYRIVVAVHAARLASPQTGENRDRCSVHGNRVNAGVVGVKSAIWRELSFTVTGAPSP